MSTSSSAINTNNASNPAVKRIMREYSEFQSSYSKRSASSLLDIIAYPSEDNLFDWHFTLRGPSSTCYSSGIYHGRILLPSTYPFKPPDVMLLTPSGRFECNKKICLSISSFHPANWQPSWSIRTVLTALIAFFPTPAAGAIGSLEYTESEKMALAIKSKNCKCPICEKTNEEIIKEYEAMAQNNNNDKETNNPISSTESINNSELSSTTTIPVINNKESNVIIEDITQNEKNDSTETISTNQIPSLIITDNEEKKEIFTNLPLTNETIIQQQQQSSLPTITTSTTEETPDVAPDVVRPVRVKETSRLSSVTVFLFVLILLILTRKLIAHLIAAQSNVMISQL